MIKKLIMQVRDAAVMRYWTWIAYIAFVLTVTPAVLLVSALADICAGFWAIASEAYGTCRPSWQKTESLRLKTIRQKKSGG